MFRRLIALAAASLIVLSAAASARAIVGGEADEQRHPNVGALIVNDDGVRRFLCSGTLISPTVFLTAGHCTADVEAMLAEDPTLVIEVTFDTRLSRTGTFYPALDVVTHPDFDLSTSPNTADIGVVLLSAPVPGITPAQLPSADLLDPLAEGGGKQSATFTLVGYGIRGFVRGGGPPQEGPFATRMFAMTTLVTMQNAATRDFQLQLANNRNRGGAACFGDSGGPVFLGGPESNLLVAVISYGRSPMCPGARDASRLDTDAARESLGRYVTLP